eukprot:6198530-Pleurochrysis_carterae.AAC.1
MLQCIRGDELEPAQRSAARGRVACAKRIRTLAHTGAGGLRILDECCAYLMSCEQSAHLLGCEHVYFRKAKIILDACANLNVTVSAYLQVESVGKRERL